MIREDINKQQIEKDHNISFRIAIEEKLYKQLRQEFHLSGDQALEIISTGGAGIGGEDHIKARIYQHGIGQYIDIEQKHGKGLDHKYHDISLKQAIKTYLGED